MVKFTCTNCGCDTTLADATEIPRDLLCPPCHFLWLDWEDDPEKVALVERNSHHIQ